MNDKSRREFLNLIPGAVVAVGAISTIGLMPGEAEAKPETEALLFFKTSHTHSGMLPYSRKSNIALLTVEDPTFTDDTQATKVELHYIRTTGTGAAKKTVIDPAPYATWAAVPKPHYHGKDFNKITVKINTTHQAVAPGKSFPVGIMNAGPGTGSVLVLTATTPTAAGPSSVSSTPLDPSNPLYVDPMDDIDPCS